MGAFDDIIYSDPGLAAGRSQFGDELSDPSVAYDVNNRIGNEVGGQTNEEKLAFIESVMNRARNRGMSLDAAINDRGYFPNSSFRRGIPSADYRDLVDRAMAGSNVARWGTGNESGDVHSGGALVTMRGAGGERTVVENPDAAFPFKDIVGGGHFDDIVNAPTGPKSEVPPLLARPQGPEPTPQEATTLAAPEGSPGYQAALEASYRASHPAEFAPLPPEEVVRQNIMRPNKEVPFNVAGERPTPVPSRPEEDLSLGEAYRQGGVVGAAFQEKKIPYAYDLPENAPMHQQITKALMDTPVDFANFILTPEGAATVAGAGTGVVARAAITAGFTGSAIKQLYEANTAAERTKAIAGLAAMILAGRGVAKEGRGGTGRRLPTDLQEPYTPPPVPPELMTQTEAVKPEFSATMAARDAEARKSAIEVELRRRTEVQAAQPHVDPDTGEVVYRPESPAQGEPPVYRPQGTPVKTGAVGEPGPESITADVRGSEKPVESSQGAESIRTAEAPGNEAAGPKAEAPGGTMSILRGEEDKAKAGGWDKYDEQYFARPDKAESGYPEANVGHNVGETPTHTTEKIARVFERLGLRVRDTKEMAPGPDGEVKSWIQFEKGQEPSPRQQQRALQKLKQTAIPYRYAEAAPAAEAHPATGIQAEVAGKFHGVEPGKVDAPELIASKAIERAQKGLSDPAQIATRVHQGIATNADEMADLHVEHARLMNLANDIDPENTGVNTPAAERAFQEKISEARSFYRDTVKPAMTEWGKTGRAMQQAVTHEMADPLTRSGFKHIAEARMEKEMTPKQEARGARIRAKYAKVAKENSKRADKSAAAADKVASRKEPVTKEALKSRFEKLVKDLTPCEV